MISLEKMLDDRANIARLLDECKAEMDRIDAEIKAAMQDQEEMTVGRYKITWKPITQARVDTTALKKALPEIAERFTKTSTYKRFSVRV